VSHKSGHIIIERAPAGPSLDVVQSARVELQFPPGTTLEEKLKKIRRVEQLLDKLDHDED
jgi:hypothetical protein